MATGPLLPTHEQIMVDKWSRSVAGHASEPQLDRMDARPLALLDQTLRPHLPSTYPPVADAAGSPMPPAAHLVYFPSPTQEPHLAPDGYHADEAPPPPFAQRVWAGGQIEFAPHNPLRVDSVSSQTRTIVDVTTKDTAQQQHLVFVKLKLQISNHSGLCLTECRDLAYMKPTDLRRAPVKHNKSPDFTHALIPSEILLFRYSALSWNSHRIHYDAPYACSVERHPALLVHGPLTCTLLLQLLHANMPQHFALKSFDYRAIAPAYCQQRMTLNGRWIQSQKPTDSSTIQCELWASNNEDGIAMKGVATLVPTPSSLL